MILKKITVGKIGDLLYCLFIVVFLALNNVRPFYQLIEFSFIGLSLIHYLRRPFPITFFLFWGLSWVLVGFISILFAEHMQVLGCVAVIQMVLIVNLIYARMHENEKYFRWFLNCYWASLLILFARQVASAGLNPSNWTRLGSSFGSNANYVGIIAAYAGIFAGLNFFYYKRKYGIVQFFIAVLMVFLSGSRTSLALLFIGVSVEILCEIQMVHNGAKRIGIVLLCVLCACLALFLCFNVPVFYSLLGRRIESFFLTLQGRGSEASSLVRFSMVNEGLEVFSQHPIIGVGVGNSGVYSVYNTYFHNNYVEVLAVTGLLGFLVYYSFWAIMFIMIILGLKKTNKSNPIRRMLFCAMGILIAGLVGDFGHVSYYAENSFITLAVLFYLLQRARGYYASEISKVSSTADEKNV